MPAARIIPCLDVRDGRVVKGVQFRDHRDVGDIVEHALRYRDEGADELVFYDITASAEGRSLDIGWVRRVAAGDRHPVLRRGRHPQPRRGGRLPRRRRRQDLDQLAGARESGPDRELARDFGSQCVVLGIDSFAEGGDYCVNQYTGSSRRPATPAAHARLGARGDARGAGEIVLNCMRSDGVRNGYDIAHTRPWSTR